MWEIKNGKYARMLALKFEKQINVQEINKLIKVKSFKESGFQQL